MFIRMLWVASAILVLATALRAEDCPIPRGGDEIATALETAPSCEAALKLFQTCAHVSSIDSMFGGIVTTRCEGDFLSKISAMQRKSYDKTREACTRKYAKKEGTMYRSFEAFCHAKLARAYALKFGASPKDSATQK
jgi:hypothetical protein